jgi:hypothetical protein
MAFVQIDVSAELQGVGGPMTAVEMAMVQSSLQLHIRISQRYCMLAASSSNASLRACTISRYRSGPPEASQLRNITAVDTPLHHFSSSFFDASGMALSLSLSLFVCVCVGWKSLLQRHPFLQSYISLLSTLDANSMQPLT